MLNFKDKMYKLGFYDYYVVNNVEMVDKTFKTVFKEIKVVRVENREEGIVISYGNQKGMYKVGVPLNFDVDGEFKLTPDGDIVSMKMDYVQGSIGNYIRGYTVLLFGLNDYENIIMDVIGAWMRETPIKLSVFDKW